MCGTSVEKKRRGNLIKSAAAREVLRALCLFKVL